MLAVINFPKCLGHARGNQISENLVPRACQKKRGFEEEMHPILGPLEKQAKGLQEEAHQDLSAEISEPRDRHARHFQQETRQVLGSTSSGAALSECRCRCVSPVCLRVCFWQAGVVLAVR